MVVNQKGHDMEE